MWTEKDMIYLPPMIKLEYLKKIRVRWIILAIFLVAIWIVMGNPRLGEWYSRSIYPWVSGMLSRFSCLFPFSVGDCFIYGSIAGLLGGFVICAYKEAEAREDIQACRGISGMGVCLVLYRLGIELFQERLFLHGRKSRMRLIQPTLFVRSYPLIQIR